MITWNLVSRSFRLLGSHKKLMVFPILSAIGAAALALPFLLALFGMRPAGGLRWGSNTWLLVLLWYCGASFITVFCNCALAVPRRQEEGGIVKPSQTRRIRRV